MVYYLHSVNLVRANNLKQFWLKSKLYEIFPEKPHLNLCIRSCFINPTQNIFLMSLHLIHKLVKIQILIAGFHTCLI